MYEKPEQLQLVFLAMLTLVLVRCQKLELTPRDKVGVEPTEMHTEHTQPPPVCGIPVECPLWAGQTINAGTVKIYNDANNLYVTYTTTGTFKLLHLWVGTNLASMPQTPTGNPIPGHFPYKYDATGKKTYTFTIPLKDIRGYDMKCGLNTKTPIYIVAHAEVIINGKQETAFGGCIPVNVKEPGRWYYYAIYTVQCCNDTPPPPPTQQLGTAFGYGNYVFTYGDPKSNPDGLKPLNLTKNRWGWALNLKQPTTTPVVKDLWVGAGLNYTSKGMKVGSVIISYTGSTATVTYSLLPGYGIGEAHIYASDWKSTTIAPGQYGSTHSFSPPVSTFTKTFNVSDTNGDGIWIITHAVAYGPATK